MAYSQRRRKNETKSTIVPVNDNEAATYAVKDLVPLYDDIFQKKFNSKALGLYAVGASEFLSTKPVKTFEDIKGMLVGVVGPVSAGMVEDLGAAPVTMMWYDFYQSLQKKVIDSCVSMITAGMVMNLFDYCKNVSEFYGPGTFQGLSMNLDVWRKMPPHIQKILMEEVKAHPSL